MKKYLLIAIMALAIIGCTKDEKNPPDDTPSGPTNQELIAAEKQALIDIYNNNGGVDWTTSDNWLSDKSVDQWYGITVNDEGFVTAIDFNLDPLSLPASNGLAGPLDFSAFTKLTFIDISFNEAVTSIVISKNTELTDLHADRTSIESIDLSYNTKLEQVELYCGDYLKNITVDYKHIPTIFKTQTWGIQDAALYPSPKHNYGFQYPEFTINNFDQADMDKNIASDKAALLAMINDPKLTVTGTLNWDNELPLSEWDYIAVDNFERVIYFQTNTPDLFSGSITLSGLTKLKNLWITENPELTSIELSDLPALEQLSCSENSLSALDVSSLTSLKGLFCDKNNISSLDVSALKKLEHLSCTENRLTSLNVSGASNITVFHCNDNSLSSLDISPLTSLAYLFCQNNNLLSLDASDLKELRNIDCRENNLTSINVSGASNLETLSCSKNALTSLEVTDLPVLESLFCSENALTSLKVSKLTGLEILDCNNNNLTSLEVADMPALVYVICDNNALTYLELSDLPALQYVNCMNNQLTDETFIKNNIPESTLILF